MTPRVVLVEGASHNVLVAAIARYYAVDHVALAEPVALPRSPLVEELLPMPLEFAVDRRPRNRAERRRAR